MLPAQRMEPAAQSGLRRLWRHGLPACVIVAGVLFLYQALLSTTGMLTHEDAALYLRIEQYLLEFRAGRFPPRLFPTELGGRGTRFHCSTPARPLAGGRTGGAAGRCHLRTPALLLITLASGFAMYGAAVACGAGRWLAVACALVYLAAPYRFVNVFVRGALAESAAFIWYPLIVASGLRAARRSRFSVVLAVSVGGLLLTHSIMALYFALFCLPFAVPALLRHRKAGPMLLAAVAVGGMLSLWHHLPVQALIGQVRLRDPFDMRATLEQVVGEAITSNQILNARPDRWFGFSPTDMSFPTGLAPALAIAAALLAGLWDQIRGRRWTRPTVYALVALASMGGCILFALAPGPALALLPDEFAFIQFPWRVLGIAAFLAALAPALASPTLPK